MTVPATDRRAGPFNGTGSQVTFPFSFRVFSGSDIRVVLANTAGAETTVTSYTATINADQDTSPGGSVTLSTAPAVGETLVVPDDDPGLDQV